MIKILTYAVCVLTSGVSAATSEPAQLPLNLNSAKTEISAAPSANFEKTALPVPLGKGLFSSDKTTFMLDFSSYRDACAALQDWLTLLKEAGVEVASSNITPVADPTNSNLPETYTMVIKIADGRYIASYDSAAALVKFNSAAEAETAAAERAAIIKSAGLVPLKAEAVKNFFSYSAVVHYLVKKEADKNSELKVRIYDDPYAAAEPDYAKHYERAGLTVVDSGKRGGLFKTAKAAYISNKAVRGYVSSRIFNATYAEDELKAKTAELEAKGAVIIYSAVLPDMDDPFYYMYSVTYLPK